MAAQTGKNFHRYSIKEVAVFLMTADSGSLGPTYDTTGYYIPGAQTLTISGAASQEQLEGDSLVLAVESTDEALDISIEHAWENFDMMEVVKGWVSQANGNDYDLWDTPATSTVYCKVVARCHKTGVSGGDLLITLYKVNFAAFERSLENKAFGKNSLTGKAIYTTSTQSVGGNDVVVRARFQQRETAAAISLSTDTTAPTCTTSPADAATGVAVSVSPTATFSEDLDPAHATTDNCFIVKDSDGSVVSSVVTLTNAGASTTVEINPASNLSAATAYTAYWTTNLRDKAGNKLAAHKVVNFTTA